MSYEEQLMKVLERIATALENQAKLATDGMALAEEMKKLTLEAMEEARKVF